MEYLQGKDLNKSREYLEDLLKSKSKWAKSHHPLIFDAGIFTTSRAESCNALIKQYVNSRSEISDLMQFIVEFEEKYMHYQEPDSKALSLIENTQLAKQMKSFLSTNAYYK